MTRVLAGLLVLLLAGPAWAVDPWSGCDFMTGGTGVSIVCPNTTTGGATITATGTTVTPGAPRLFDGCGVAWVSGFTYDVSAATYLLGGTLYTSAAATVTLDTPDAQDRFDIIAVNTSGTVEVIKGTAGASPVLPALTSDQLQCTFVLVQTATVASPVTNLDIYHENVEWTTSVSGGTIDPTSTSNPHLGSKDIEGTATATGNWVQAEQNPAGTTDLSVYNNLVFYLRSKAAWATPKSLQIQWRNAGVNKGTPVTVKTGTFGFDSSVTSTYQVIVIPTSLFNLTGTLVNQIRFTVLGGGSTIGWYIDDVMLQAGVTPAQAEAAMTWRGAWSATTSYVVQDVVSSSGVLYVAIQPGLNKTPAANTAYWTRIATITAPTGTGTSGRLTAWTGTSTLGDYAGSSTCTAGQFVTTLSNAGAVTCGTPTAATVTKTCTIVVGADNGTALANADLGPQTKQCMIPEASTITEITVNADAGTPSVLPRRINASGTAANLLSGALSTASAGGVACAKTSAVTGLDGITTCSATLQNNTSIAAGVWLELLSGTAGGTAKRMTISITYTSP